MSDRYPSGYKFIASTKPLEGIPVLVIEDEVENVFYQDNILDKEVAQHFFSLFKEGYNKAKETYKFTEEDLTGFGLWLDEWWRRGKGGWRHVGDFYKQSKPVKTQNLMPIYLKEISKKELWVEVEGYKVNGMIDEATSYRPKITEGKIKAVWK